MDYELYSLPPHPEILHPLASRIALQVLDLVGIGSHPHPMDAIANETFHNFIASTITVSKTKVSVILVASLYLRRCKSQFDVTAFGQLWLKERVFIAAIALAYKYMEDLNGRASQWARLTGILSAREIGVAERTFLQMLNWDLSVSVDYFSCPETTGFFKSLLCGLKPVPSPAV